MATIPNQQPLNQATGTTSTTTTVDTTMPNYADPVRKKAIEDMYAANLEATKSGLKSSYDQNLSNLEDNRSKIAQQYQNQRNQAAIDYEKQRRNFLESAAANGLNVGAGAQAQLAQNAAYQKSKAGLLASEAEQTASANKSIADLKIQYQNDINSAAAENDYKKAAALLDEYNQQYSMAMERAQAQAQYGVFDGYSDIYGADVAKQMAEAWAIQNPVLAYSLGRIDAAKYHQITGSWPPGYRRPGSGYSGNYVNDDDADEDRLGGDSDPASKYPVGSVGWQNANDSYLGNSSSSPAYGSGSRQENMYR